MAKSTSSQHRAQLFRDLSKDSNRTRNSSGSSQRSQRSASPQPSVSDFNPEKDEALESTRTIDAHAQRLPELRASAQKYNMFAKRQRKDEDQTQDYEINTSAVGRAFPDFSQGSSAFENGLEPDSPSIEIGRGAKKASGEALSKLGRSRDFSSNAHLDVNEDSFDSDKPFDIGNGYQVMYTPPFRSRQISKKTEEPHNYSRKGNAQLRKASGPRKQIVDPSPPHAKIPDYGSGESRKASKESRPPKASKQPRVRDENDLSHMSEDGAPAIELTARNTRFGNIRNQQNRHRDALPSRFSSAQTLMNAVAPNNKQQITQTVSSNPTTLPSFILPAMPRMNELVSGVFDNGTPVFSRDGRPSRFMRASQKSSLSARKHPAVDEIAMRTDEQAIYLQLQMLQDKCAQLEKIDVVKSEEMRELKEKNAALENRQQPSVRRDSGLGTSDSDVNEMESGSRKLLIEKTRLESSVRALQSQVDTSSRKVYTSEKLLNQITKERDAAVSQLSVAWCTIEEVKVENEDLKAENEDLHSRMNRIEAIHQDHMERCKAVNLDKEAPDMQPPTLQNNYASTSHFTNFAGTQQRNAKQTVQPIHKDANTMFDLSAKQDVAHDTTRDRQSHLQADDIQCNETAVDEAHKNKGKGAYQAKQSRPTMTAAIDNAAENLTYLSFIDTQEIAKLRKTLEKERIERKQQEALKQQSLNANLNDTRTGQQGVQPLQPRQILPRKSSMKDATFRSALQESVNGVSIHSTKSKAEHNRRHSDTSILSTRSRRHALDPENMTSAFIVPDITIRGVPEITKEDQKVLYGLANHKGNHCTVCQRDVKPGEDHDHVEKAVKIPKPIPITDRVREAHDDEYEPTIRPSQPPGLALATVLKGLEDELDHLEIKVMKLEASYHSHDKSSDRRKRKAILERIQCYQQEIEVKSDQIYSLYDVLEGQKEANQEMSDEDAEITMESIGLDPAELHLRGGADHLPWDLESTGTSDGLPWEGIESTS